MSSCTQPLHDTYVQNVWEFRDVHCLYCVYFRGFENVYFTTKMYEIVNVWKHQCGKAPQYRCTCHGKIHYTVRPWTANRDTVRPWTANHHTVRPWTANCDTVRLWTANRDTVRPWTANRDTVRPWPANCDTVRPWTANCVRVKEHCAVVKVAVSIMTCKVYGFFLFTSQWARSTFRVQRIHRINCIQSAQNLYSHVAVIVTRTEEKQRERKHMFEADMYGLSM